MTTQIAYERGLVEAVLDNPTNKRELKQYLTPLVDNIASLYAPAKGEKIILINAAWTYLDLALKRFNRLREHASYEFGVYFSWYAKQAMEQYLDEERKDVNLDLVNYFARI